jgi:hypothetical protein
MLLPERLEWREGRVEAEESIEIEHGSARNVDAGPHCVILRLPVRHDDVQTVGCSTLEDYNQALDAYARLSHTHGGAGEKARHCGRPHDGECAVTKKHPTSDGHKKLLLFST